MAAKMLVFDIEARKALLFGRSEAGAGGPRRRLGPRGPQRGDRQGLGRSERDQGRA